MTERPWEFPVPRMPVQIATTAGPVTVVDAPMLGGLAVTPSPETFVGDERAFVLTHVSTGRRFLLGGWETEAGAIVAMRVLLTIGVDWTATEPKDQLLTGFRYFFNILVAITGGFQISDTVFPPVQGHA